jgi:hypothetical protein
MECFESYIVPIPLPNIPLPFRRLVAARCCCPVAGQLPFLLPTKSLTINICCRVADFPEQSSKCHEIGTECRRIPSWAGLPLKAKRLLF